jgi:ABC-type Fe3+ transport system permease subunit
MSGSYEVLWSMFLLGSFKFLFAAAPGAGLAVPFFETVAVTSFGAILSAMLFFYAGSFIFQRIQQRNRLKSDRFSSRRVSRNRKILQIKSRIGFVGFCYLSSVLFPVPLGAIVCSRFYRHRKLALPLMAVGIVINAHLLALIWYGILR